MPTHHLYLKTMLKTTFTVGDRVTYSHPLDAPFDGHYVKIEATIIDTFDNLDPTGQNVRLSCKLGSIAQPKTIELWTNFDRLTQLTQISDPDLPSRRFSKAQQIDTSDWDSWVFDDELDKYFESIDDLLEFYEDEEIEEQVPITGPAARQGFLQFRQYWEENGLDPTLYSALDEMEDELLKDQMAKMEQSTIHDFFTTK
ncbi:MAG: hypothetical protein HC778_04625 [Chamaesiphon sp. CSU_1_12]|nr:hypothetical protein [Chamaesiphon sp. CSU_1_12]